MEEIKEYYDDLLKMFEMPGWKHLIEDFTKFRDDADHIEGVEGLRELGARQGELKAYSSLINYEDFVRIGYENKVWEDADI